MVQHGTTYKSFTMIIAWLMITFLLQTSSHISTAIATENTAVVIRSQQITAYNEAIKGFEEGCKGENISISAVYDLKGDPDEGKRVVQTIRENKMKPGIILAVGVLAATLVKEQFTDIPIIFCMVINYERFNLQGVNISGISSEASLEDQFSLLRELLGPHKNVGVVYDPTKTEKIVSKATIVAKKFDFTLVKTEVLSEKDVASALKSTVNNIDALWMIPDSTVITKKSIDIIPNIITENHLPIFCTSDVLVRAGALVSISPDYAYICLQAAQIAQTLLNNPANTSLGIRPPEKLKLTLNTQAAEIIGINRSSIQSYPDVILYP